MLALRSSPCRAAVLAGLLLAIPLLAGCSDDGTGEAEDLPVVRGRLHVLAGTDPSAFQAVWRTPTNPDAGSASPSSDGTFEIRVTTDEPSGELLVRDPAGAFHPFLFPFDLDELESLGEVQIVMVPRRWTIAGGAYDGEVVETSLDPAVDDTENFLYTYFWGQPDPEDDDRFLLDLMTWREEDLPARVAFDHRHGDGPTPEDSAAIWAVLDRMEAVFGLDLFEPVEAEPDWWPDPPTPDEPDVEAGVVRLVHSPPSWGGLPVSGAAPASWQGDLGAWASGGRFERFRVARGDLDRGLLFVGELEPLRLNDGLVPWETVLTHEMLHVLGVGHTCRIPSPQGPCVRTAEPSKYDVAYMAMLRAVLRLEEQHDTFLGVLPAVIGERMELLGLPALPTLGP